MPNFHKSASQIAKNIYDHSRLAIRVIAGGINVDTDEYNSLSINADKELLANSKINESQLTKISILLEDILVQLKINNLHLEKITNENIKPEDIE